MMTVIDSLTLEEQKQIDPHLFTCCPNCNSSFKIPPIGTFTRGNWLLAKDATFYKGDRINITMRQSHIFYEIAKSPMQLKKEVIGYRVCNVDSNDFAGIVDVQLHRVKKLLLSMDIPYPIFSIHGGFLEWKKAES